MSGVLQHVSEALAGVVEMVGQSVVRVEARRHVPASGIVWSADGLVVSAHHVIEQDEDIEVGLPDGRAVPGTLVGRDPATDIALVRAQAEGLTPPEWAEPDTLQVGHLVLALGRPGRGVNATLGIVSALGEAWRTPTGGHIDRYLQTDVVMYPGFSGGPLVDVAHHVLGLNSSALLRGISLTVPVPTLRRVVEALVVHGRVRRGYLGVGAQTVRLPAGLQQQVKQETGLLVVAVESGSPAERAGLLLGDTIVGLDHHAIRHLDDLLALLSDERIGTTATLHIVRGGQAHALGVTVGERT